MATTHSSFDDIERKELKIFNDIERTALEMKHPQDLVDYQNAILKRYWPEFQQNGHPTYFISLPEKVDIKDLAKRVRLALPPVSESLNNGRVNKYVSDIGKALKADDSYGFNQLLFESEAKNQFKVAFSFLTFGLDQSLDKCKTPVLPVEKKFSEMKFFMITEHEVGHVIDVLSGGYANALNDPRNKDVGHNMSYVSYRSENLAHSYAALRLISKFGAEGVSFYQKYMLDNINNTNTLQVGNKGFNVTLEHDSSLTFRHIIDKYGHKPEVLAQKSPRELFDLAQTEMRLLSRADLKRVDDEVLEPQKQADPRAPLSKGFNQLAQKPASPALRQFIDLHVGAGHEQLRQSAIKSLPVLAQSSGVNVDFRDGIYMPSTMDDWQKLSALDAKETGGKCKKPMDKRVLSTQPLQF